MRTFYVYFREVGQPTTDLKLSVKATDEEDLKVEAAKKIKKYFSDVGEFYLHRTQEYSFLRGYYKEHPEVII